MALKLSNRQELPENHDPAGIICDRGEIRDCFDIEFLVRRGVKVPLKRGKERIALQKRIAELKEKDFKVKLRSILEDEIREYYVTNRFRFLQDKLSVEEEAGE